MYDYIIDSVSKRPPHLPEYENPPLEEVVMGVQFSPFDQYRVTHARDVWELFSSDYPTIHEVQPLPPHFETFGLPSPQGGIQVSLGVAPTRNRLWFVSADDSHLIQFQEDRFLLNWRKRPNNQDYPRFESIFKSFKDSMIRLNGLFEGEFGASAEINQVEVSYINIIPVDGFEQATKWLNLYEFEPIEVDSISLNLDQPIRNDEGKHFARLHHEIQSVMSSETRQKALRLTLTMRGQPSDEGLNASLDFIEDARERIVTRFSEFVSDEAQKAWGRK